MSPHGWGCLTRSRRTVGRALHHVVLRLGAHAGSAASHSFQQAVLARWVAGADQYRGHDDVEPSALGRGARELALLSPPVSCTCVGAVGPAVGRHDRKCC